MNRDNRWQKVTAKFDTHTARGEGATLTKDTIVCVEEWPYYGRYGSGYVGRARVILEEAHISKLEPISREAAKILGLE